MKLRTGVRRTDIGTLRPVERRPDGTIVCDAYLSKCGVFSYLQPDGSIRRELRLHQDVANPDSLQSFEGRPVTNNHPPGMVDARNARDFAVGAVVGTPVMDDDHMRGRLSVFDAGAVADMEAGKTQVSNGYTCDTEETPGVHPVYGVYDAIQRNIRGNHVAIVDRARAGITASARMDAANRAAGLMVLEPGTEIALTAIPVPCKAQSHMSGTPAARIEVVVKNDAQVDPDDEAARNERGANDAPKSKKRQPGQMADKGGIGGEPHKPDPDDDEDDDDEDQERPTDAYDESYDDDGELTQAARDKIKASNFAVPDQEKLPIHDKPHVRAAMSRFGQTDFKSADEKHAAFNRIKSKAKAFGVSSEGFEKAHGSKLDRAEGPAKKDPAMTIDIKALQEKADKADKRKEKLVAAKTKIDALEIEVADLKKKLDLADGQIENLKRDQKAAPTTEQPKQDAADVATRVDAALDLLERARSTGAKIDLKKADGKIKTSREVMCEAIKHVDGEDIPADKSDDVVAYVFEGACKRANKDAAATTAGANAIANARVAAESARQNAHLDTSDEEEAAKQRMRAHSYEAYQTPSLKGRK